MFTLHDMLKLRNRIVRGSKVRESEFRQALQFLKEERERAILRQRKLKRKRSLAAKRGWKKRRRP